MRFRDIHTHDLDAPADALISVEPDAFNPRPGRFYSVGIHPWSTDDKEDVKRAMALLSEALAHPQTVALGEVGLDRLRGGDLSFQREVLERQLALAEQRQLPVIIHAVRATQEIIDIHRRWRDRLPSTWIVHGMRQGPRVARMLLDEGFHLSFGHRFNADALRLTPPERRHAETDTEPASAIAAVEHLISQALGD